MREEVIAAIENKKLIAIIRGANVADAVAAANALLDGGISLIEVTFNQKDPSSFPTTAESIRAIIQELGDRVLVGAGTVLTTEQVEMAAQAGAKYIISPDTDCDVIRRTLELGLVSLPGAYTATEAKRAYTAGADFVKIFPCIGDAPAYVKALCAPLSHIRFLAVGGVNVENCTAFLNAGAVGLGIGSCLVSKERLANRQYDKITDTARQFVEKIKA